MNQFRKFVGFGVEIDGGLLEHFNGLVYGSALARFHVDGVLHVLRCHLVLPLQSV